MRVVTFRRLVGAAIVVGCTAVGCDQVLDEKPLRGIKSCGVDVHSVNGGVVVGLSDSQGDAELVRIAPFLKRLRQTIHMQMENSQVTDAGLVSLKGLNNIRLMRLEHANITDAGLDSLTTMAGLGTLGLTGTQVTEAGIKKLKRALPLVDVEILTAAQERGFEQIVAVNKPSFNWWAGGKLIGVDLTNIADTDLRRLKEHLETWKESLQELGLSGAGVADAGLNDLKGLSHLRRLTLIGTSVTDAGAQKLRQALPQLEVLRLPPGAPRPPALPPP